jgi:hypothetical protein
MKFVAGLIGTRNFKGDRSGVFTFLSLNAEICGSMNNETELSQPQSLFLFPIAMTAKNFSLTLLAMDFARNA